MPDATDQPRAPRFTVLLGINNAALATAMRARWGRGCAIEPWPELDALARSSHPCTHGDLADDLLALGRARGVPVVVCTHATGFVLRVRRRVAEGTLKSADVALIWIEPDGTEKPIPLDERGEVRWWPQGIGSEEFEELKAIRRAQRAQDEATAEATRELTDEEWAALEAVAGGHSFHLAEVPQAVRDAGMPGVLAKKLATVGTRSPYYVTEAGLLRAKMGRHPVAKVEVRTGVAEPR